MRRPLMLVLLLAGLPLASAAEKSKETVAIVWVNEHSLGSAAQMQPYVDRFSTRLAEQGGWASAKGTYLRSVGELGKSEKPAFGFLTLPVYLAMRKEHGLVVVGQLSSRFHVRQYRVISRAGETIDACKGKTLVTDHARHAEDRRFLDRVVAAGAFTLADFTVMETGRPTQTIKKVVTGEAACALVDSNQWDEVGHMDGAEGIKSVWASEELPPAIVVAFPAASKDDVGRFQKALEAFCTGDGKTLCAEVGMSGVRAAKDADYADLAGKYDGS